MINNDILSKLFLPLYGSISLKLLYKFFLNLKQKLLFRISDISLLSLLLLSLLISFSFLFLVDIMGTDLESIFFYF